MTEIESTSRESDSSAIAPRNLERVRQFINTLNIEANTDQLSTIVDAYNWLSKFGLINAQTVLTSEQLDNLRNIREALRSLALANNHDELDQSALDTLNRAAQKSPLHISFSSHAQAQLRPDNQHLEGAIATLFMTIYEAMQDGTWSRLKACRNDECLWVFYDHSKNRSGKWCSMAICGGRMKVRAFRARQTDSDS